MTPGRELDAPEPERRPWLPRHARGISPANPLPCPCAGLETGSWRWDPPPQVPGPGVPRTTSPLGCEKSV